MTDCNHCARQSTPPPVPYIVHEAEMARAERTIRRLCIVIGIQAALAAASILCRMFGL